MSIKFLKVSFFVLIFYLLGVGLNFAQDAQHEVRVQLALGDGKKIYRTGEPLKLVFSFTAARPGYKVEKMSFRQLEQVIVTPADGTYTWNYRYPAPSSLFDDVVHSDPLSAQPETVEKYLNNFVAFAKPGKYSLKVISSRVFKPEGGNDWGNPIPILTNAVDFEIIQMSDEEERAEMSRLDALMAATNDYSEKYELAQQFYFLNGEAATREKVKRYLAAADAGNENSFWAQRVGILMAQNRALAIKLLDEAFADPRRGVDTELIYLLTTLRMLEEEKTYPVDPLHPEAYWQQIETRTTEISLDYHRRAQASLAARTGASQLGTAFDIFIRLPPADTSSEIFTRTKAIILANYRELSATDQDYLMQDLFETRITTKELLPEIERILATPESMSNYLTKQAALKRLIKFDQRKARPIVIDEIRRGSNINAEVLGMLNAEYLPEIDDALLDQIQKLVQNQDVRAQYKFLLAARYATGKIYPPLLEIYRKYGAGWYMEERGPLLAYLARINDRATRPLIEQQLANNKVDRSGSNVLFNLTRINPLSRETEKLLRGRLNFNEPEAVGAAAYYLSQYPNAENRRLIEKRYASWLREWKDRGVELNDSQADQASKSQAQLQITLLEVLLRTKAWQPSETDSYRLRLSCLTEACRREFSRRDMPLPKS